jgi:hypothetical protein
MFEFLDSQFIPRLLPGENESPVFSPEERTDDRKDQGSDEKGGEEYNQNLPPLTANQGSI